MFHPGFCQLINRESGKWKMTEIMLNGKKLNNNKTLGRRWEQWHGWKIIIVISCFPFIFINIYLGTLQKKSPTAEKLTTTINIAALEGEFMEIK